MGRTDIPFIIAIYNDQTQKLEFVTNMSHEDMANFIGDIACQINEPASIESYDRNEGLQ